jgi:hypothetical protein
MASEQQVKMAARLYEARDTIRRLLGDRYAAVLEPYKVMLQKVMTMNGCDEIAAALWTARRVERTDGMEIIKILAAAVEMIEPTQVQHSGDGNG